MSWRAGCMSPTPRNRAFLFLQEASELLQALATRIPKETEPGDALVTHIKELLDWEARLLKRRRPRQSNSRIGWAWTILSRQ